MSETPWYILRCRPCSEFKARDAMTLDHRIAAYVPVEFSSSRFGKGRETVRRHPVVRGYVFAAIGEQGWASLGKVREITGAVFVDGRPARLTQRQVDAIELLSRPLERANSSGWSPGDRVRVRRGAYAELEAVVAEIKRGTVIGKTEMFGKVHVVRLRPEDLEAA